MLKKREKFKLTEYIQIYKNNDPLLLSLVNKHVFSDLLKLEMVLDLTYKFLPNKSPFVQMPFFVILCEYLARDFLAYSPFFAEISLFRPKFAIFL